MHNKLLIVALSLLSTFSLLSMTVSEPALATPGSAAPAGGGGWFSFPAVRGEVNVGAATLEEVRRTTEEFKNTVNNFGEQINLLGLQVKQIIENLGKTVTNVTQSVTKSSANDPSLQLALVKATENIHQAAAAFSQPNDMPKALVQVSENLHKAAVAFSQPNKMPDALIELSKGMQNGKVNVGFIVPPKENN